MFIDGVLSDDPPALASTSELCECRGAVEDDLALLRPPSRLTAAIEDDDGRS